MLPTGTLILTGIYIAKNVSWKEYVTSVYYESGSKEKTLIFLMRATRSELAVDRVFTQSK